MPRTTRTSARLSGVAPASAIGVPALHSAAAVKRRRRSTTSLGVNDENAIVAPAPAADAAAIAVEDAAEKENGLADQEALQLVAAAYAQTLKQPTAPAQQQHQQHTIKSLADGMDGMQVAKKQVRKAPTKRTGLQQRDENVAAPAVDLAVKPSPLVLSPRTLLVPSTLPETAVAELKLPPPIVASSSLECMEELGDEPAASTPIDMALAPDAGSKRIDSTHALPAPYVTINPDLLRDAAWQFRDLQLLCMRLGLGGRGTRSELVERLLAWHRKCFHKRNRAPEDEEDDHPLSISKRMKHASNFSLLQFDTSAMLQATSTVTPPPASSTPPLSPFNDDHANGPLASVTVSTSLPQLLTPLLYRTARRHDGTPRSILSPSMRPKSSSKRLSFSVFNGVKLIPDRHTSNEEQNTTTPSPTKRLSMDEADECSPVKQPELAAEEAAPAPSPSKPSFLSSVSAAIMTALTPRKSQPSSSAYPPHCNTTAFTFDRLPSIEAHHGDESEIDTSMEE